MSELEDEIERLRSRNAELREAIEMLWRYADLEAFGGRKPKWLLHALSTDCGKGFHSEDEVKPLVEVIAWCREHFIAAHGPLSVPSIVDDALAHWRKDK